VFNKQVKKKIYFWRCYLGSTRLRALSLQARALILRPAPHIAVAVGLPFAVSSVTSLLSSMQADHGPSGRDSNTLHGHERDCANGKRRASLQAAREAASPGKLQFY
jgi:hypothetical protein